MYVYTYKYTYIYIYIYVTRSDTLHAPAGNGSNAESAARLCADRDAGSGAVVVGRSAGGAAKRHDLSFSMCQTP